MNFPPNVTMQTFPSREEWLQARKGFIGGSDAACIIGKNPWKSNVELFREKFGITEAPDLSDNDAVVYGRNAEELIRGLFALDYPDFEVGYAEDNFWTNLKYPFAHASLDGWITEKSTGRHGIFECKTSTPGGKPGWAKWKDRVPENYYCQLLHYMAVCEADFAILRGYLRYTDENGLPRAAVRDYRIEREEVLGDIEYLMSAEEDFHNHINGIEPNLILPGI